MTVKVLSNPENHWARRRSLPVVYEQFLQDHLADWPELCNRSWQPLDDGLRSWNLVSGDLVARIAIEKDHSLLKEAALLRLVGDKVRVPRVIDVGSRAILLEYIPVSELPATEESGQSVGASAALIHGYRYDQAGLLNDVLAVGEPFKNASFGLTTWFESVLENCPRDSEAILSGVAQVWKRHAARLEAISESPVLVHADFKPANVKWSENERRAVVFDWEFAWAGPNLFDVGQLFRWQPPASFQQGFQRGYVANGGRLPDDWPNAAELFDLLNLANFLVQDDIDPKREKDVRRRIQGTLARQQDCG